MKNVEKLDSIEYFSSTSQTFLLVSRGTQIGKHQCTG